MSLRGHATDVGRVGPVQVGLPGPVCDRVEDGVHTSDGLRRPPVHEEVPTLADDVPPEEVHSVLPGRAPGPDRDGEGFVTPPSNVVPSGPSHLSGETLPVHLGPRLSYGEQLQGED